MLWQQWWHRDLRDNFGSFHVGSDKLNGFNLLQFSAAYARSAVSPTPSKKKKLRDLKKLSPKAALPGPGSSRRHKRRCAGRDQCSPRRPRRGRLGRRCRRGDGQIRQGCSRRRRHAGIVLRLHESLQARLERFKKRRIILVLGEEIPYRRVGLAQDVQNADERSSAQWAGAPAHHIHPSTPQQICA